MLVIALSFCVPKWQCEYLRFFLRVWYIVPFGEIYRDFIVVDFRF
jgi:hypothetical protein